MTERERALLQGKKINPLTANESAIAYAVAHGGGSEPTYETVAEIPVGTMVENEGVYQYEVPSESRPNLQGEDLKNLYIDGHKLEKINAELFAYNVDPQTMRPIASPAYGLGFDGGKETGYDLLGIVTYPDLSNTTVRILKKVEQGGTTGGKLVVHLTETAEGGETVYTADKTIAEIVAANADGKTCECSVTYMGMPLLLPSFAISSPSDEAAGAMFSCAAEATAATMFTVQGARDGAKDEWRFSVDSLAKMADIPSLAGYSKTYEFGYTLTPAGEGGYTATPEDGATYANIKAALAETPNVRVRGTLASDNLTIVDYIDGASYVAFNGVFNLKDVGWCAIRLWVDEDGTSPVAIARLVVQ